MTVHSMLVPSAVAVAVLLAVSAFFSSSESAIFSLPAEWRTGADGSSAGVALRALREDPHRLLVTILVGNNLVNIAISSIVTVAATRILPPGLAVVVATLCVSVLVLVFGEIVPKAYGLGHARSWSLRVAAPLSYVGTALGPVVTVFDVVTRSLTRLVGGDQDIEEPCLE